MPQTITATSGEILAVEEVKRYLRIPDNIDDEDAEINVMITAARIEAEAITHRTLRASVTRVDVLSNWFTRFKFKNPPLHTTPAETVQYYDSTNSLTTVADSNYDIVPSVSTGDENEGVSYLQFDSFFSAPILYDRRPDRILITYTTGYVSQDLIPETAKHAVKMIVWNMYYGEEDNRHVIRAKQLLGSIAYGFYA